MINQPIGDACTKLDIVDAQLQAFIQYDMMRSVYHEKGSI